MARRAQRVGQGDGSGRCGSRPCGGAGRGEGRRGRHDAGDGHRDGVPGRFVVLAPDAGLTGGGGRCDGGSLGRDRRLGLAVRRGCGRLRASRIRGRGVTLDRCGGGRPDPLGRTRHRVDQLLQFQSEGERQPAHGHPDEDDERPGRGQEPRQVVGEEPADTAAGHAQDLGGTDDPDIGDGHAGERDPPA